MQAPTLTENELTYDIFYIACISLSALGITFIYVVACLFKTYKSRLSQMVLYLCLANLFLCIPYLTFIPANNKSCLIVDILDEYFLISSFCWSASFAYAIKLVLTNQSMEVLNDNFRRFFLFCQGVPLLFCAAAGVWKYDYYDEHSDKCIHSQPNVKIDLSYIITVAVPFIVTLIASVYCFAASMRSLKEIFGTGSSLGGFKTLFIYPTVLIICWAPATVANVVEDLTSWDGSEVFAWFYAWARLQGFFNALVYGLNNSVASSFKNMCKSKKRKTTSTLSIDTGYYAPDLTIKLEETLDTAVDLEDTYEPLSPDNIMKRFYTT